MFFPIKTWGFSSVKTKGELVDDPENLCKEHERTMEVAKTKPSRYRNGPWSNGNLYFGPSFLGTKYWIDQWETNRIQRDVHLAIFFLFSGWWFQPLWKILVSWDYYSQYIWNNKTCSKPPTSFWCLCFWPPWIPPWDFGQVTLRSRSFRVSADGTFAPKPGAQNEVYRRKDILFNRNIGNKLAIGYNML